MMIQPRMSRNGTPVSFSTADKVSEPLDKFEKTRL